MKWQYRFERRVRLTIPELRKMFGPFVAFRRECARMDARRVAIRDGNSRIYVYRCKAILRGNEVSLRTLTALIAAFLLRKSLRMDASAVPYIEFANCAQYNFFNAQTVPYICKN